MEEAAELLRVGRTKAYAMAREWRATGGLSGLPVIDLGDVLRVPLWRLEAMVGGELHAPSPAAAVTAGPAGGPEPELTEPHQAVVGPTPQLRRRPTSRRRAKPGAAQLTLLHADDATSALSASDNNRPSTGSN